MSFPRYPHYKDSGVEWLGEVPGHWEVCTLRRCLVEHRQGYYSESPYVDSGVKLLRITDLRDFGSVDLTKCPHVEDRAELLPFMLRESDFVFARTGGAGLFGLVHAICEPVAYASYLIRFRFSSSAAPNYLRYYFLSWCFREAVKQQIHGGVNQNIHAEDIKNQFLALPPNTEQTQIAAFLDRETAKIDGLVAEQRRLMALLKEKRQAVISHAVTRGLNPHAPLKPSGIEWLGDVPAHWEVIKLSRLTTKIGDGLHGTPEYIDESEFYFINGNNLVNGTVSITDTTRCVSEVERDKHGVELNQTTVLLSINGTIGNFALYRGESVMLGKSAAYINCGEKVLRDYLCWCMQSSGTRRYFDFSVTGTTIYNLSLDSIRKMPIALPPCDEQVTIGAFLVERAGEYDGLLQEAQRAIDLLQERRTALISAAVTGQIDVRGGTGFPPARE